MQSSGKTVGAAGALGALSLLLWTSPGDAGAAHGMPPELRNLEQNSVLLRWRRFPAEPLPPRTSPGRRIIRS
jgi:hypothetical protein